MIAAAPRIDVLAPTSQTFDLHQHYWPPRVVELLREREALPRIAPVVGHEELWLPGEAAYPFDAAIHELDRRARDCAAAGIDLAVQAPPCALGIEWLDVAEAQPLFDAWVDATAALPEGFGWWAWASATAPDVDQVRAQLAAGAVGLVVPAASIASPHRIDTLAPVLALLEEAGAALLVHPGVAPERLATPAHVAVDVPAWLPAITDYATQMATATIALHRFLRPRFPSLGVVLTLLGGLTPLQYGRAARRGAPDDWARDTATFYETASFDPGVIDAVAAVVGTSQVRYGTDAPVLDISASHRPDGDRS